jgi:hypothetical protein
MIGMEMKKERMGRTRGITIGKCSYFSLTTYRLHKLDLCKLDWDYVP